MHRRRIERHSHDNRADDWLAWDRGTVACNQNRDEREMVHLLQLHRDVTADLKVGMLSIAHQLLRAVGSPAAMGKRVDRRPKWCRLFWLSQEPEPVVRGLRLDIRGMGTCWLLRLPKQPSPDWTTDSHGAQQPQLSRHPEVPPK